ncbi:MAG: sugar transferase [Proteobacteria bacterium]|nr:sugar transferase [Pseudomonadota bacterium]
MRSPFSIHKTLLAVLDITITVIGFSFTFWYVFPSGMYYNSRPYPVYFIPSILTIVIIFLITFQLKGLYKYQVLTDSFVHIQTILNCYVYSLVVFVLMIFFMKTEYIADSRLTIGLGFLFSFILMIISRVIILPRIFCLFVRKGIINKKALIVGAGIHGRDICNCLDNNPESYFEIVGFVDDNTKHAGTHFCGKEVLGTSHNIAKLVKTFNVKEIIIAISNIEKEKLLDIIDRCKTAGVVIHVISELFLKVYEKLQVEEFGGLITYRIVPGQNGVVRSAAKRIIDVAGSGFLLMLSTPLFLIIALAVKRDSHGPTFYRSEVVGRGGRTFLTYKFRTMIDKHAVRDLDRQRYNEGRKKHTEFMKNFIQGKVQNEYYLNDESRITRVGRFLRKYSFDELPQLINVFKGEMSLVGPRFCSPEEYSFYKPWHKQRFAVKPGITGVWQVFARSAVSYDDMVMLDLYYIQNKSLLFDLEILLRTVSVVLFGRGSRIIDKQEDIRMKVSGKGKRTKDKGARRKAGSRRF